MGSTGSASGRSKTYAIAAGVTGYPVTFPVIAASDLLLYVHDAIAFDPDAPGAELTEGVHYNLTGDATRGAASAVPTAAFPVAGYLTLYRVTSMAQTAAYTPNDGFPAKTHEAQLDRLSLVDQEQQADHDDLAARALVIPAGETVAPLASPAANAGKFLATLPGGGFGYASGTGNDPNLRTDLAAADGGSRVGAKAAALALVQDLLTLLRQREWYSPLAFGCRPGVMQDQGPAICEAYEAAQADGKNLLLPPGDLWIGSAIPMLPKVGTKGHGWDQTRFRHLPDYHGAIFTIPPGPITYGALTDLGIYGTGDLRQIGYDFHAQPGANGDGGIFSWLFARYRMENLGVCQRFWGGPLGNLPHQFLTFADSYLYRAKLDQSQTTSFAGQIGQVFTVGTNEWDSLAEPGQPVNPGTNVCLTSIYERIADGAVVDGVEALAINGGLNPGYANIAGDNNQSYDVHFDNLTIQSGYSGLLLDNAKSVSMQKGYFENTAAAITAHRSTGTALVKMNNAGWGPTSQGGGYLLGGSEGSIFTILDGSSLSGKMDRLTRKLSGNPYLAIQPGVEMPRVDLSALPSGCGAQLLPDANGILDLGQQTQVLVGDNSGVLNINGVTGVHPPGVPVFIVCATGSVLQFNNNTNPDFTGYPPRMRPKDGLILQARDVGDRYEVLSSHIGELVGDAQPPDGYFAQGERVRCTGPASYTPDGNGRLLSEWRRKVTKTGPYAAADWQIAYAQSGAAS